MTRADRQRRLTQFHQAHRAARLPVTTQRLAVFTAILERTDHPTADRVYEQVRARLPRIARMTVYRILGAFAGLGLITKTCHPGAAARFDPKTYRHHHLVCRGCDQIIDLEEPRLNGVPRPDVRRYGFQIEDYHIHFRGRCARCREKASARPRRPKPQRAAAAADGTSG